MQQLGKYQLIRKLATGGMAEVYLAKAAGPMGFEKTLVVKRILPHLAEDPQFVEMFLGEAKLAAQLNHPNIVQIFDFGEADGEYFLAMEYIDGPNLRVLLKRANASGLALPPAVCARLIALACEGLAFAHDFQDPSTGETLGLIHRDISPDNILVSRQGAVKVVDFGIAKAAGQSHKTQSGVIKGKLAYMPPEQVRAKPLDRRVDVYALGVVLYELLTRHKPFEAGSDAGIMQAILFEPQTPALEHRPDLPEALQRILERALHKDREQRYPDCLALAADLEEFILSVGKPVTTQQIVQLIAQVTPNTDTPVPTPHSGTGRGVSGSGPRASATPTHTPAPGHSGVNTGARSGSRSGHVSRTGDMAAPVEAEAPAEAASSESTSQEEMPARTVTLPSENAPPTKQQEASAPASRRLWLPAALGAVLLLGGGGFVFWRTSSQPTPVPQTPVVLPANPEGTTGPKSPGPVVETHPSGTGKDTLPAPPETPSTNDAGTPLGPPPENPPKVETQPPAVATNPPSVIPETPTIPGPKPQKPPKPGPRPPKPTPVAEKPVGKGTFIFRVRPYATVILNGKNLGQTPFDPVEAPAGKYTVQFINTDLNKKKVETYELKPGESKTFKINLEE